MSQILYCRGPMVELLISSDVAKYCEFRTITRVLTQMDDKLEKVGIWNKSLQINCMISQ